ncbi:MAG TPA: hypothetical protein VEA44_01835 [Caulobacter sp.]|nr:hypothetical protein [Caulobacter sp.]
MSKLLATIPLPDLLTQVGREFDELAGEVEQLQETLSEVLLGARHNPDLLRQAQALDHVFQHMTQLALIVSRTADQTSDHWRIPAELVLKDVSLADLVGRLTGASVEPVVSGEMDLF